ncbi:MAG: protein-glutamate O-methyltransferase [Rhodospirillaceae bacterium]|nr:protein-glutamate O-methyltransferase [Rhodospirillaceae bacterium]
MNSGDFDFLANLVKSRSGLILTADKSYLLESRLVPLARRHGMQGLDELAQGLRRKFDEKLAAEVTDAMTTNESLFFRDMKPFDQFRDIVLPKMLATRADRKAVHIWSAACSSGQEPYSLAILLNELGSKIAGWRFEIIATDISTEMVTRASEGVYSQFEVQRGLPIQMLVKYFKQDGNRWLIDAALKRMINFREFNLLGDPAALGSFDVIFCRNVLIYFDQPTKTKVLAGMAKQLRPDGYLYLGGAETVIGISDKFEPVPGQRGIYQKTGT